MTRHPPPPTRRRGRPPKYGKPSELVAVTLPSEILERLRARHSDIGWAIVSLVEEYQGLAPSRKDEARPEAAHLVRIGEAEALIAVPTSLFRALPGVQLIPLSRSQSFLALDPGKGMADLEVTVIDRLERSRSRTREHQALTTLLGQLRRWRRDPALSFAPRSIIIVNSTPRPRARGSRKAATRGES